MGLRLIDRRRFAVLALFTLSGASGLASEIVWMRLLSEIVGGSHAATSLVLAVFMAGLALGAALLGPRIDRTSAPLAVYGRIEIAIGLFTLALPVLASVVRRLYLAAQPLAPIPEAAARLFVTAALLLLPTALMGATLPAIVKALGRDRPSATAGRAYASNVLGAVAGALAGGLWVLPRLGVTWTNAVVGTTSLFIGVTAWILARREPALAPPKARARRERPASELRLAWVLAALGGAGALGLEVVWMRILSILTADTVLAQTATLGGYLLGLALGGHVAALFIERVRHGFAAYALCQLAVAGYALASPALLAVIESRVGWRAGGPGAGVFGELVLAAGFFIVPAALSGASLILLFGVSLRGTARVGERSGRVAGANSLGAMLGALGTGLWAVPAMGSQRALVAAAALSVLAALLALSAARGGKRASARVEGAAFVAVGVVLALGAFALRRDRYELFGHPAPDAVTVFAEEDEYGLAEVRRHGGELVLVTDRKNAWGSTHPAMLDSMRQQGLLPLVLHPAPHSVVEIGIGTGVSFAPVLADPTVTDAEMVEISPAVVHAARLFAPHHRNLHEHPKLSLRVADGRHHLLVTDRRYDVIVLGLFTPHRAGAGYLFSRDLYRACRERLRPGGLLVHWLPLDQLRPVALSSILRSFASELDRVHAFDRVHYLALVGSSSPIRVDAQRLAALERLAIPELAGAEDVLASHLFGRDEIVELGEGAPLNTDDFPFVEFHPAGTETLGSRQLALENLERLLPLRKRPVELVGSDATLLRKIEGAWLGRELLIRGGMAQARGDHAQAKRLFARALEHNPKDRLARAQLAAYER